LALIDQSVRTEGPSEQAFGRTERRLGAQIKPAPNSSTLSSAQLMSAGERAGRL
jgi:hypothetical protein